MGKPAFPVPVRLRVDYAAGTMIAGGQSFKKGDQITVDGSTGQVLAGKVEMVEPQLSGEFSTLIGWADKVRRLGVRANADTPADAKAAVRFGAEGIGLCRTEHMFFESDRIQAVREMILPMTRGCVVRRSRNCCLCNAPISLNCSRLWPVDR